MITIIGNIKVDESKPERIKYLLACIRSYQFLKEDCKFVLSLHNPSASLYSQVLNEVRKFEKNYILISQDSTDYGTTYTQLINNFCDTEFVINFMEDQFMLLDDKSQLVNLLEAMKRYHIEVCKATFFDVEHNSIRSIRDNPSLVKTELVLPVGYAYHNDKWFHLEYQKHYGSRYYIGCNFITTKEFALKFWNRQLGKRPHPYEVSRYEKEWDHWVIFPNFEIQCAIDDNHGEDETCLLERDCDKWNRIWNEIK